MSLTVRSLLEAKAVTEDQAFPVRELFYRPEDWSLRYALLDVGGWLKTHEILVSTDRLAPPTEKGWPLSLSGDELQAAPVIDTIDTSASVLPPLVVGPFGKTFSPLAIAAKLGLVSETAPDERTQPDTPRDGTGRIFHLDRISDLLGMEIFTDDGPQGTIEDVQLDENMKLTHAIVGDGDPISLSRLRRVADQGHLLFT